MRKELTAQERESFIFSYFLMKIFCDKTWMTLERRCCKARRLLKMKARSLFALLWCVQSHPVFEKGKYFVWDQISKRDKNLSYYVDNGNGFQCIKRRHPFAQLDRGSKSSGSFIFSGQDSGVISMSRESNGLISIMKLMSTCDWSEGKWRRS